MIKVLESVGIKRKHLTIIRMIYNNPISNVLLNYKSQIISTKIGNKTRISTLSISVQYSASTPSYRNNKVKEMRG